MYLFLLIHLSMSELAWPAWAVPDTTAPTWLGAKHDHRPITCPDSSSSQCQSSTSVCTKCVQNTITFSTQADVFVALQPANIGSFSSPLFPHLLKESHLFRCLLRSFFHSFCLSRHIVLSQHSSSQPGQNQLHPELSCTWPVIWGTRGQPDG